MTVCCNAEINHRNNSVMMLIIIIIIITPRLLERANIIQTRLNEETAALSKAQANFQRTQQNSDEDVEEFQRYCSEALFRIQILENRLRAHEKGAIKKYTELDEKLSNDPRLLHALRS